MTGEDKPLTMSFFLRYGWSSNGTATNYTDLQGSYDMFQRQQISFLYGASFNNNSDFQVYNCTPHVITVETHIECQSDACSVTRLRRIRDDPFDPWDEACDRGSGAKLKCLTLGTQTLFKFFMYFPSAVASYFSTVNPFDDWIAGSNQTYRSLPGDYDRDLRNISDQMVSDRLTTVLNTYWQAGSWGTQVTRAGSFEIPEYPYFGPLYGVSQSIAPDRWINATETTFKTQVPVYVADVGWICALLLISLILLSLGIVNVAVTFMNKAPDLFYYASSLARENPYTNTPDGGTWLDGAERSRLLKDMKVQIADASPENEVGYVVIKSLEEGEEFRSGRLKKGRLYW
ncbi:hypothetical protein N0V86_005278 [Didymella sp. IMI 355093]|nr:hypothetical protein N0V86_005278 [Didymella sp. IMI 355093]